jgi:hypothetical protein
LRWRDHALQIMQQIQSFLAQGVGRDLMLGANVGPGETRRGRRPASIRKKGQAGPSA